MDPTNPEVIRAIREVAAEDTPASHRALYTALLASQLLVPTQNAAESTPAERSQFAVVHFGDSEALPVFTDWDAVALWPDRAVPAQFMVFRGQGVFILARRIDVQHVLINPSGPIGIRIDSMDIRILGDGALPGQQWQGIIPIQVKKKSLACFGPPRTPVPRDLVERMQQALQTQRHVKRAFLFEGSSGVCVGLEFRRRAFRGRLSTTEIEAVMRSLCMALRDHLGDQYIDCIVLDGPLLDSVKNQVPAFFPQTASK
jgi:hypothetical protein